MPGGEQVQPGGLHVPPGALSGVDGLLAGIGREVPLLEFQLRRGADLLLIGQVSFLHRQSGLGGGDGPVEILEGELKGGDSGGLLVNGGLIGIVTDVGLNYATVRTIIDDSSNVSGMSQRTGDICNVAGDMELYEQGRLGLDHIRKESDIESGDRIVTSNISEVYLPGILIGYAENVVTDANNITKSGALIPAGTFEGLQEVLVITQLKNELQIGDEAAEEAPEDHNDTPDEIETESEEEESEETEE